MYFAVFPKAMTAVIRALHGTLEGVGGESRISALSVFELQSY